MRDCFLILSCSKLSTNPLCYSPIRSIYSYDERISQLIASVKSVKRYHPSADIYVLEASEIQPSDMLLIEASGCKFLDLSTDSFVLDKRDSPYKGLTEYAQLLAVYSIWKEYDRFFKLSGRYTLNSKFKLDTYAPDHYSFLFPYPNQVSTVLFSVSKNKYDEFHKNLVRLNEDPNNRDISIENRIFNQLTDLKKLETLGVEGNVSVDGTFYQA